MGKNQTLASSATLSECGTVPAAIPNNEGDYIMKSNGYFTCCVALGLGFAAGIRLDATAEELTFADLADRMIDLERLAVLPAEGETNAMWSSYDRAAKYDAENGKYVQWQANGDGNGLIRMEGTSQVIAEMEGPGVIWRIWSAKPEQGHVKVHIDGEVAIDMPFAHYFDAAHPPFNFATLGYESGRGKNVYFPIPYQKSCKILAEEGWGRYYQITYTTYPAGTKLPCFSEATSPKTVEALKGVDDFFANQLGTDPAGKRDGQEITSQTVNVPPGQTETVASLSGSRAITALKVRSSFKDRDDQMAALRKLVLQIQWDGQEQPAVWCPLGDFFGTAPGVNLYKSLWVGMTEDGFYSVWYMPFGESAVVELVNEGETAREVSFEITHAPLSWPFDELAHFHAKWHRDIMPVSKDRWPDWTVVRTKGRGRFCGMMLHVWNPRGGQCAAVQWCNGHWWWGEGDEKFFVDGETFPSTFGTGTEDYFGYAWGCGDLFHRPFNNQTMTENNAGHQSVNRFQIADNVPFQKSFDGYLEKYFPNDQPTLFAAVAYWYVSSAGVDPHGSCPADQRDGYYARPPAAYGGFEVGGTIAGRVQTQGMQGWKSHKWKDDDQLWWTQAQPGAKLNIKIPVEKAGHYDARVVLTKAIDYGIVQLSLDGQELGDPIDLYDPDVVPTETISLGTRELAAGDHTLTVEIVGANEKAVKSYMVGLDQFILDPVQ